MLLSLALLFIVGMVLGKLLSMLKLPSLVGFIITGIVLGPYCMNVLDHSLLTISSDLRQLALIIILIRAGLNLDFESLKKAGRPAILLCFVPATIEIIACAILGPIFLGLTTLESLLLGTVIAAVSPAVIVPRMLHLIDTNYGTSKSIPQMVMTGASLDDIYVIILFTIFSTLLVTGKMEASSFLAIPSSICFGLLVGWVLGRILSKFFTLFHMRDSSKVLILLSISFILTAFEKMITGPITYSGLLAVMTMCAVMNLQYNSLAVRLSSKFSKLWVCAEICLFVLVGACVNITYIKVAGILSICFLLVVCFIRFLGVILCMTKTNLTVKERMFVGFSYLPKATVQAAIGSVPLSMGLACGNTVLTIAVLSILLTAPIGAVLIDRTYEKFLNN